MKRLGEVVASTTTHFTAQALRDPAAGLSMPKAPPFGSFVRAQLEEEGLDVFGLVFHVETASIDTTHRPQALALSRQELREQQPQIFGLLRTDFSVLIMGFREGDGVLTGLPPLPPQVHDFVYACTADEVVALTDRLDFLRTVVNFGQAPADELVVACLRQARRDEAFLLAAGRELANLLRNDYARLDAILGRLERLGQGGR